MEFGDNEVFAISSSFECTPESRDFWLTSPLLLLDLELAELPVSRVLNGMKLIESALKIIMNCDRIILDLYLFSHKVFIKSTGYLIFLFFYSK